jgi:hypothetical protein
MAQYMNRNHAISDHSRIHRAPRSSFSNSAEGFLRHEDRFARPDLPKVFTEAILELPHVNRLHLFKVA